MSRLHTLLASLPPDFPPSTPLSKHDQHLSCSICKQPFEAPVSILCGHSFCSRCIRDAIQAKNKTCPTCKEPMRESDIRRNRLIEDLVESWSSVRPELVEWATNRLKRKRSTDSQTPVISPLKRDRKRSTPVVASSASRLATKPSPIPVIEVVDLLEESDEEEEQVARAVGRGVRSSSDRAGSGEIEVEDQVSVTGASSDTESYDVRYGSSKDRTGDLIDCPVCGRSVLMTDINAHLDRKCSSAKDTPGSSKSARQTTKTSWEKLFAGTTNPKASTKLSHDEGEDCKRIAKPNYHLASQKELRGICENYGLNTHGDKGVLAERLQMWISMFNANLDTSNPKTIKALRGQLERDEKGRIKDKTDADKARGEMKLRDEADGTSILDETDDVVFRHLTREIRERKRKALLDEARAT